MSAEVLDPSEDELRWEKEHFNFLSELDNGAVSVVELVQEKNSNEVMVAKKILKRKIQHNVELAKALLREKEILLLCRDYMVPNVVDIRGTFQDEEFLYFILEYIPGGNMRSYVEAQKPSPMLIISWMYDILVALEELHQLNIMHGDLKLDNFLLTKDMHVVLCDFNSAVRLPSRHAVVDTKFGSAAYLSPEAIFRGIRGLPCDMWAIGVILYELFCGELPFEGEIPSVVGTNIHNENYTWIAPFPEPDPDSYVFSPDFHVDDHITIEEFYQLVIDLILQCWEHEPRARITPALALQHTAFHAKVIEECGTDSEPDL